MRSLRMTRKALVLRFARSSRMASSFCDDMPWVSGVDFSQVKAGIGQGMESERIRPRKVRKTKVMFTNSSSHFFNKPRITPDRKTLFGELREFLEQLFVDGFEIEAGLALHARLQFLRHGLLQLRAHVYGHEVVTHIRLF